MNSFDVFDTLIGRRGMTSLPIFEQLAREFGIGNLVEARIRADTGALDLDGIYRSMGIGANVMARELELEHEHIFPIQENLDRVRDGDLLVSDTYLSACDVLSLLRRAGLDKQVTLYQSNAGKRTGDFWRRVTGRKPDLHLGDHAQADFAVPRLCGVDCELYQKSGFTEHESYVRDSGLQSLALLMREVRLRSAAGIYRIFREIACQLNLPWLFVGSELLRRRNLGAKVFLGRDCQLLYSIYRNYFEYSYYLPFSRKLAFSQPVESIRYLLAHAPKQAHFVDIGSTGATWAKLQAPFGITAMLFIDSFYYTKERPVLPDSFSHIMRTSEFGRYFTIELFNCGDHGYASELDRYGDGLFRVAFSERNEIAGEVVEAIHGPVGAAVRLAAFYRAGIAGELSRLEDGQLRELFRVLAANIGRQSQVEQYVPGRRASEADYLTKVQAAAA